MPPTTVIFIHSNKYEHVLTWPGSPQTLIWAFASPRSRTLISRFLPSLEAPLPPAPASPLSGSEALFPLYLKGGQTLTHLLNPSVPAKLHVPSSAAVGESPCSRPRPALHTRAPARPLRVPPPARLCGPAAPFLTIHPPPARRTDRCSNTPRVSFDPASPLPSSPLPSYATRP